MNMPKHDRKTDWTYSVGCGCKVTFYGEYDCEKSRLFINPACETHGYTTPGASGLRGVFGRDKLHATASELLRQAIEGTI